MTKILFLVLLSLGAWSAAFGSELQQYAYEANLPLYDEDNDLGDVTVEIEGEKVIFIDRDDLKNVLQDVLKDDTLRSLDKLPKKVRPDILPFAVVFSPEELKLLASLGLEIKSRKKTDLGVNLEEEKRLALRPAPFGGAINYRLEKNWAHEDLGGDYFDGQFNSFMNLNSLVLENQTYYQDNKENPWFRGDTRLVKDFEKSQIRAQAGDVYPQIQGFMAPHPMGGINIARNFTLNPYRLPYPTGNQNFTLKSRSFVKYFVNSVLVKSEYLPAGNYTAKDIPLNNGLNTVLIEATDDLGQKQVFVFRASSSISLLNEGESRFDLSYGVPFLDSATKRQYLEGDGKIFSGFFQYGFSSLLSSSVYLQNQNDFNLTGAEVINATAIGNFTLGGAHSMLGEIDGNAASVGYQLVTQGQKWFDSHTLGLRYEFRSEDFKTTLLDVTSSVQNAYAATYTVPIGSHITLAMGGNYGDVRNNDLENRYGYDASMSFRLFNQHNVSVYVSRNRDEFKKWNDVAYVFFTFMFPESNNFVSGLYDYNKETVKATLLRDNQNRLYKARAQAIAEYGADKQNGEVDLSYPTPVGDFGGRITGNRLTENNQTIGRGSARINSALVFAYDDGEFGGGISRPIPGSFVLFKPETRLKDQKIGLKSTSPFTEAESGLFDEIVFSNLIAYQYRDIQLDPTFLDPGRTLVKEKFMLYPTYRSAHLITLRERGAVVVTGTILNADGSPLSLQVGSLNDIPFFTNSGGMIFIEGVEPGRYEISLPDREEKIPVFVNEDDKGMKNLGTIQLKDER
ncbi:fimbria/pilus outer membrane usher protein [Peredibacter sp. HCB2-198]|uniref:fimbria/pilus outer membrane usher protein n=1 Tax=Peredibacter sp. HCB2-198 TaxID=3383025 RepID=UPI0038B434E2